MGARAVDLDKWEIEGADWTHIVVIPDVHGDRFAFIKSLWLAHKQVSDDASMDLEQFNATFVDAISSPVVARLSDRDAVAVVILGDLIDRGPFSADCLMVADVITDVLGWEVTRLYGNHETMTVAGLFDSYVHPAEMFFFGGPAARRAAFAPGGHWFKHITDRFVGVAKHTPERGRGTLFVHGGIETDWFMWNLGFNFGAVDEINALMRTAVSTEEEHDRLNAEMTSPVWSRMFAVAADEELCGDYIEEVLEIFNVDRIVVGHSPQMDGYMKSRCGGRVILADVAMSRWMRDGVNDRPAALIFALNDGELMEISANYLNGELEERVVMFDADNPVPEQGEEGEAEDGEEVDEGHGEGANEGGDPVEAASVGADSVSGPESTSQRKRRADSLDTDIEEERLVIRLKRPFTP